MKINTYNQQFENETKGRTISKSYSFINICLTLSTIALVATTMFIITKKTEIHENTIITPNLQNIRGKFNIKDYQNYPSSSPSLSPSNKPANIPILMPIQNFEPNKKATLTRSPFILYGGYKVDVIIEDDDNIETLKRKSKYPTRYPKKDVNPTPNPSVKSIHEPNIQSTHEPTTFILTDDFHVTPIIVINDEEKETSK